MYKLFKLLYGLFQFICPVWLDFALFFFHKLFIWSRLWENWGESIAILLVTNRGHRNQHNSRLGEAQTTMRNKAEPYNHIRLRPEQAKKKVGSGGGGGLFK